MSGGRRRDLTVDTARGAGMLAVIFYHLVYRSQDSAADIAAREIGWCMIPFFFLVSGYFWRPGRRTVREGLARRLRGLLVPAVRTTALLLTVGGVYCALFHGYGLTEWARDILHTYLRPELASRIVPQWGDGGPLFSNLSPVWYIWTMSWTTLLFVPLADAVGRDTKRTAAACLILLAAEIPLYTLLPPSPWGLTHVPVYAAVMLFGAWAGGRDLLGRILTLDPRTAGACTAAAVLVHVLLFRWCGTDQMYAGALGTRGWIDPVMYFAQTLIGTFALLTLCRGIRRGCRAAGDALAWIGERSMTYLLWHCALGMIAADVLRTYIKPGPDWYVDLTPAIVWKSIAGYAFAVAGCTALAAWQDRRGREADPNISFKEE